MTFSSLRDVTRRSASAIADPVGYPSALTVLCAGALGLLDALELREGLLAGDVHGAANPEAVEDLD